jgi:hypothetical protein
VECRAGYRRVRLCVREDLYRAIVIIEASEGVRRYKIIEDALLMYLDSRRRSLGGGFRFLTISEDLYNELARLGGGDAVVGLRRLLGSYQNHQLVRSQDQVQAQPQPQMDVQGQSDMRAQEQVQAQAGVDFLDNNPWVGIIRAKAQSPQPSN